MRAVYNLEEQQPERLRLGDLDNFNRCSIVIQRMKRLAGHLETDTDIDDINTDEMKNPPSSIFQPFEIILDDPAGNSFIENPFAPKDDPFVTKTSYFRTPMQDLTIGLQPSKEAIDAGFIDESNPNHVNVVNTKPEGKHLIEIVPSKSSYADDEDNGDKDIVAIGNLGKQEALKFPTVCAACYKLAETTMCVTDIPHFKEVVIMSLLCDHCGYKSNEIKGGGAIPKFGTRIILSVKNPDDLQRELLKSDTAGISIPEIELELQEGSLDGLYTTVEGLLDKLYSRLESVNPFHVGDAAKKQHRDNDGFVFSSPSISAQRYLDFLSKLLLMKEGKSFPFTIVIKDPLSNSFVGPIPADAIALALKAENDGNNSCYSNYIDRGMCIEEYERSFEENEVLGLNDMKTENYTDDEVLKYHATDQPEDLPDRLRRLDHRGPDHPYAVAKAPVEGDTVIMGSGSNNFATPALGQRGIFVSNIGKSILFDDPNMDTVTRNLQCFENNDSNFIMSESFDGRREGMIFKLGRQGLGYYTDITIDKLTDLVEL